MRKLFWVIVAVLLTYPFAAVAGSVDLRSNEKSYLAELSKIIPEDKIVPVEKLHEKWLEVQAGKSKAVIIDIRTRDEFDTGHIMGANNIDSGHAYTMPKKYDDPETEIWVFCRTQHRATYFVSLLYHYGYKNVYLVEGGVVSWIKTGYPLVNEYMGQIMVTSYSNKLKENFDHREGH